MESCTEASLLTSTFKLFLRELVEPLINEDVRDQLYQIIIHQVGDNKNTEATVLGIRKILTLLDDIVLNVLRYLLLHLKVIANVKGEFFKYSDILCQKITQYLELIYLRNLYINIFYFYSPLILNLYSVWTQKKIEWTSIILR